MAIDVNDCVKKDSHGERRAKVSIVLHMYESLLPVQIIYEQGEFYGVWTDGYLDDSEDCSDLDAMIKAFGDECWANVQAHRDGPTLSLRDLAAKAAEMSA